MVYLNTILEDFLCPLFYFDSRGASYCSDGDGNKDYVPSEYIASANMTSQFYSLKESLALLKEHDLSISDIFNFAEYQKQWRDEGEQMDLLVQYHAKYDTALSQLFDMNSKDFKNLIIVDEDFISSRNIEDIKVTNVIKVGTISKTNTTYYDVVVQFLFKDDNELEYKCQVGSRDYEYNSNFSWTNKLVFD